MNGAFVGLPNVWPEAWANYHDINSGGNSLTIYYGHCACESPHSYTSPMLTFYVVLDSFTHVLGGFSSVNSILKVDEPEVTIGAADGSQYQVPSTAPNEIFVQGLLKSGAVASVNFRNIPFGNKTVDDRGLTWIITGTEGEIELAAPESSRLSPFLSFEFLLL